jgi:DNA primase
MTNEIIDFIKRLLQSKHGSLEKARYSLSRDEINARCPYCLDSRKNTRKRRFYYSLKDNVFYCHNCGRKGPFAKLLNDFKNLPTVDYDKLEKEIGLQKVKDFIDGEHKVQEQKVQEAEWSLEYPDGARLDTLFENKVYKKLPQEDKQALLKACKYLQKRGVKKEWYRYFYFVFPGEEHDGYILTLFEYNGNWIWSGRKIEDNRPGPKYLHVKGFPFHLALGFANEVSTTKGDTLYVVESWFSALALNQANLNAVCVFGLQNMRYNHSPLDPFNKKYDIVFVPDNDETFKQFYEINKDYARKIKIVCVPDKDVADTAVREGESFRKKFKSLKTLSLYDFNTLNSLKTLI